MHHVVQVTASEVAGVICTDRLANSEEEVGVNGVCMCVFLCVFSGILSLSAPEICLVPDKHCSSPWIEDS